MLKRTPLLAAALALALFPTAAVATTPTPHTLLKVTFHGAFHGQTYQPATSEQVNGTLTRDSGREKLSPGGVTLAGGDSGLRFTPSDNLINDGHIGQSLVAEALVRRDSATPSPLATLFDLFGASYFRYPSGVTGATEFGAGAAAATSRDLNDSGYDDVALVYTIAGSGAVTVSSYVDGCRVGADLPVASTAVTSAAIAFGHASAAGSTGLAGRLSAVALSTFSGAFTPADLRLPVPHPPSHSVSPATVIPVGACDSARTIVDKAASVVPADRQVEWQQQELTGFIHFGPDTFTNSEPGNGKYRQPTGTEPVTTFAPTDLDTDQWAKDFADAGFKKVILVAKHHDGFLLWPSAYSAYSVRSDTAWQDGHGDLVGDFVKSARKYGLKVGLYLSPADLHEAQPGGSYGDGSSPHPVTIANDPRFRFTLDDYNTYYLDTMYELLTRYGSIDEVWLDGYNPTNRPEPYATADWYDLIHTLQPGANIFNGQDVRWVGNEDSAGRASEWSPLPFYGDSTAGRHEVAGEDNADLGGRDRLTNQASYLAWYPAECDARINDDWFWHDGEGPKSVDQLAGMYRSSVGGNCQFLLDVPPDTSGRLHPDDEARLARFGDWVRGAFGTDQAAGARTAWHPTGDTGTLTETLPAPRTFDKVRLGEDITRGQRVESFAVDAWEGGGWQQVAAATTIGYARLLTLPAGVTTDRLRVRVLGARAPVHLAPPRLYATG